MTRMLIVCRDAAEARRVKDGNPKSRVESALSIMRGYGAPAKRIVVMPGVDLDGGLEEVLRRRQAPYFDRELVVL